MRRERPPSRPVKSAVTLGVFLLLAFLVGGVGGSVTQAAMAEWYPALAKPRLTPPDTVFGIVWPLLFATMSVAAWLAWREGWREPALVKRALRLHFRQLLVAMAWSVVFFGLRAPGWALAVIALLWYLTARMAVTYRALSAPAWWLTVPYLLWIGFAAYLNGMIAILN